MKNRFRFRLGQEWRANAPIAGENSMANVLFTTPLPSGTVPASGAVPSGIQAQAWAALQTALNDVKSIFDDVHGTVVTVLPFIEQIEQQFKSGPGASGTHGGHTPSVHPSGTKK